MRATGYLDTMPKGDISIEGIRQEARERNELIIARLDGEIEDEGGTVTKIVRRRDVVEEADVGEYKSYGRADW